jgi:hypothetical protein
MTASGHPKDGNQLMAFVRCKTVQGRKYYQVVRNYRENGKHHQEVLCHLGVHDSVEAAIEAEKRRIAPAIQHYQDEEARWLGNATDARRSAWRELGQGLLSEEEARNKFAALLDEDRATRHDLEYRRVGWSLDYYQSKANAKVYEGLAERRRKKLNKLLEVQMKYF